MGTIGNPTLYGALLAAGLPLLALLPRPWREMALAAAVASIVWSGSRTAWGMAVLALLWATPRRVAVRSLAAVAAGIVIALAVESAIGEAQLDTRVADLTDVQGTAAGRLYLWRVHTRILVQSGPLGAGPGGFQRLWPAAQGEFLQDNPDQSSFFSDLRHAHGDIVEVTSDFGWVGLAAAMGGLVWLFKPRARSDDAEVASRRTAHAAWLAALAGGLFTPVLFELPTLLLLSCCAGLLAEPAPRPASRAWIGVGLVTLLIACAVLGQRVASELARNQGLRAELAGDVAAARSAYSRALDWDPTNPLAGALSARSRWEGDPTLALVHIERALRELPTAWMVALELEAAQRAGDTERAERARQRLTALGARPP